MKIIKENTLDIKPKVINRICSECLNYSRVSCLKTLILYTKGLRVKITEEQLRNILIIV